MSGRNAGENADGTEMRLRPIRLSRQPLTNAGNASCDTFVTLPAAGALGRQHPFRAWNAALRRENVSGGKRPNEQGPACRQ
jgi:hypothetical protein